MCSWQLFGQGVERRGIFYAFWASLQASVSAFSAIIGSQETGR